MLLSLQDTWSDSQAITGTANSDNVVDLGVNADIGPGTPIPLRIQATETFAGGTSLAVEIHISDSEDMSGSTLVASSKAVPLADLVSGFHQFGVDYIPAGTKGRYVRMTYTVVGTMTAGKIFAGVAASHQHNGPEYTNAAAGTH